MARSSARSAKANRATRRAINADNKVKAPPNHDKNALLQSLVKSVEEHKSKGRYHGAIALVMNERQAFKVYNRWSNTTYYFRHR
jgi:hypothetical protein